MQILSSKSKTNFLRNDYLAKNDIKIINLSKETIPPKLVLEEFDEI